MKEVVQRLMKIVRSRGVKVRYLLLDKGFFSVEVITYLKRAQLGFIIPAMARGRKPKGRKKATGLRAIEEYCRHYQRWKRLVKLVEDNGESLTYTDASHNERRVRNPDFAALLDTEKQMARFETEYGFTPSARARLTIPGEKREDPLTALFAARGQNN